MRRGSACGSRQSAGKQCGDGLDLAESGLGTTEVGDNTVARAPVVSNTGEGKERPRLGLLGSAPEAARTGGKGNSEGASGPSAGPRSDGAGLRLKGKQAGPREGSSRPRLGQQVKRERQRLQLGRREGKAERTKN